MSSPESSESTGESPAFVAPQETTPTAPAACYPLTNSGRCYKINQFCRKRDIGSSGIDVNGTPMTCVADGKRGRWS